MITIQNEYIYGRNVKISASFLKYTFLKCAPEQVFPHKQLKQHETATRFTGQCPS